MKTIINWIRYDWRGFALATAFAVFSLGFVLWIFFGDTIVKTGVE